MEDGCARAVVVEAVVFTIRVAVAAEAPVMLTVDGTVQVGAS